jgi:hypothetical protein
MMGSEPHIKAHRLFNLSQEGSLDATEEEETHLLECEDCELAVTTFALLFGKQRRTLMRD